MCKSKILKSMKEYQISENNFLVLTDVKERKYREQTGLDTLVVYTVNDECCNLKLFEFLS